MNHFEKENIRGLQDFQDALDLRHPRLSLN